MGDIGAPELLIIGVVIVLLFGATRLPATAKGLGQALKLFKREIRDDDDAPATTAGQSQAAIAPLQVTNTVPVAPAGPAAGVPAAAVAPQAPAPVQQAPVQQAPAQQPESAIVTHS